MKSGRRLQMDLEGKEGRGGAERKGVQERGRM